MGMEIAFQAIMMGMKNAPEMLDGIMKILNEELSLPNIPWKVLNRGIFWTTLGECNGWKLQQNTFTRSARILNSDGVRIAWGTVNGMEKALNRMLEYSQKYNKGV